MGSSAASPPVQAVPAFTLDGSDANFLHDPVTFFTVPGDSPARIDAISMQIDYPSNGIVGDLYGLQYLAPGGAVIGPVWTPQFTSDTMNDNAERLYLTWMRLGVGSDQLPPRPYVDLADTLDGFSTGTFALPDAVLQPLTVAQIIRAHGLSGGSPIVTVNACTVLYTPNGEGTSVASSPQGIPLLTPTDSG